MNIVAKNTYERVDLLGSLKFGDVCFDPDDGMVMQRVDGSQFKPADTLVCVCCSSSGEIFRLPVDYPVIRVEATLTYEFE